MGKNGKKRKKKVSLKVAASAPGSQARNVALDAVRGLAIILMVVDHIAFVAEVAIEPTTIRFVTRLSMPLFAVLMGFFLSQTGTKSWGRLQQLALAAALVSTVTLWAYGTFDVLASLLIASLVARVSSHIFPFLFASSFFYLNDPSVVIFDYPLSVTLSCVAQGAVLRRYGIRTAILTGAILLAATLFVTQPTVFVLWWLLPATAIVYAAEKNSERGWAWLAWIGRKPLSIYVAHYLLLIMFDQWQS